MLQNTTIDFLKSLKKNNNKEWFDKNRTKFDAAKEDFLAIVTEVLKYLTKLDSRYADLKPKECVFRINRDVRFSKDKSPYKTNMGAAFHFGGKKSGKAAFYFHLEPGNSFIGGGLWLPEADRLKKVRQEIDYNFGSFQKLISAREFVSTYGKLSTEDTLKNPPKGYEADNKAIEYLKLKSFVAGKKIEDADLGSKDLIKVIQQAFKALAPLILFLNHSLEE